MSGSSDADVVGIVVGNQSLLGWQEVRITRSIEQCPPSFELTITERFPTQAQNIVIRPGDPCQVTIGGDTVITGYVDRYAASVGPDQHTVRIIGRGMCQDLIDCSAMLAAYQVNNTTLVNLARKLCEPFGIGVVANDGDSAVIPQFNVTLTETPFEIIERIARWANFLLFEDTNGDLNIARVGDVNMASGFVLGEDGNLQASDVVFSLDNRFTEMHAIYLSTAFLVDGPPAPGSAGPVVPYIPGAAAVDSSFPARADGQPRKRPLLIVSEQTQNSPQLAKQRTQWDMARRVGRSQEVKLTCDSWRDSAGTLWAPNALAVLNLPALKLQNQTWLISSVTYERSDRGTTAEVTLMPKEAFVPEPDNILPFDWQLQQDLGGTANFGPAPR